MALVFSRAINFWGGIMSGQELMSDALPGAVGAVTGGGIVAWLTKLLLGRMISQYDRRHDQHARKIEAVAEKLNSLATRLAVLETVLQDTRQLRIDLEQRFASLRGEQDAKHVALSDEISELRRDIFVAHERVRALALGDTEISKIQAPPVVRRRT